MQQKKIHNFGFCGIMWRQFIGIVGHRSPGVNAAFY